MLVSYVLRLHTDRMERKEFVCEVEAVASGRRGGVKSLDELQMFIEATIESETTALREGRLERDETG